MQFGVLFLVFALQSYALFFDCARASGTNCRDLTKFQRVVII
jgi:hypothetical protein